MEIFILIIVAAALGVSLFFVTKAAAVIGTSATDSGLKSAHKYLTWTATLGWISVAAVIVGIILFLVFGEEMVVLMGGWIITGLMFLIAAMAVAVGVLSAIAATKIRGGTAYGTSTNGEHSKATESYKDCVIGASVAIGAVGIIIIGVLLYYAAKKKKEMVRAKSSQNLNKIETKMQLEKLVEEEEAAAGH